MHPELSKAITLAKRGKAMAAPSSWAFSELNKKEVEYQAIIRTQKQEIARLSSLVSQQEHKLLRLGTQITRSLTEGRAAMVSPRLDQILKATCDHYGVTPSMVLTERKHDEIVRIRQVVCHLAYMLTAHNDSVIARFINRDWTTVIAGRQRIEKLLTEREELRADVEAIMASIPTQAA